MNIFKILSTAHGKVYEPSITAFIAYLLNPYEGHGLKDEFLKLFLSKIIEENSVMLNFLKEKYESEEWNFEDRYFFEVFAEQSFPAEIESVNHSSAILDKLVKIKGEDIVDIIILVYEKTTSKKLQYQAKKTLKVVFLIENKISKNAENEKQLHQQYKSSYKIFGDISKELKIEMPLICTVFLSIKTGDISNKFSKQYTYLKKHEPGALKVNLFWNPQLLEYITAILEKETNGKIEPIYEYTKHTLKSFLNFIKCDFSAKSSIKNPDLFRVFKRHEITESVEKKTPIDLFNKVYDFLTTRFEQIYPKISKSRVSFYINNLADTPIQLDLDPKRIKIGIKTDERPSPNWKKDEVFYRMDVDSIERFTIIEDELFSALKKILPK